MRDGFRPEIQALRALAVLLVVVFHLWPNRVPGGYVGVDVFFVISGFLITSHLAKELLTTNGIQLGRFYARRIRRLLPAAFLVLGVTLVAVLLIAPSADWPIMLRDIISSALYSVNWVLAASSVDYFAAEDVVSPVQHYWSLAVEEQFYLLWPLLLLLAWIPRRISVIYAALGVVFFGCLAYSIWGSLHFQTFAYFSTPAHGWEFAAGAVLALLMRNRPPLEGSWLPALSWAGWAAIATSAFLFTASSPFPGWIALLPVTGTLAVIAAGAPPSRWSPTALASWRPVQFTGDISYSLYLWHFPPIILAVTAFGRDLSLLEKGVILLGCFVLAWLTKRYVEDPVRVWPRIQPRTPTYVAAVGATAALVVASFVPLSLLGTSYAEASDDVISRTVDVLDSDEDEDDEAECFGALASVTPELCPDSHVPAPGYGPEYAALDDFDNWRARQLETDPYFDPDCTVVGNAISECWYRRGLDDPFTVAIVGDSHAGHWLPAILTLAKENGWDVIRYRESGCRLALGVFDTQTEHAQECKAWKEEIVPFIAQAEWVDLVTTSAAMHSVYRAYDDAPSFEEFEEGFLRVWNPWLDAGKTVLVMSDGPSYDGPVPACVERELDEAMPCSSPVEEVAPGDPLISAAALVDHPRFGYYQTLDVLCDEELCHPVIGGIITHKDGGHISASFMVTMTPLLEPTIRELFPSAFLAR